MRLRPKLLDAKGPVALWREGLPSKNGLGGRIGGIKITPGWFDLKIAVIPKDISTNICSRFF
ncbi:MAG: hypothetical protein ABIJ24_02765 [Nitrospinota bacterium]|nr:hypothetical protein [Nitrospinota bacterium]